MLVLNKVRQQAFDILYKVLRQGAYAQLLFLQSAVPNKDRGLLKELVYGVLKQHHYLNFVLEALKPKETKLNYKKKVFLELIFYQKLFLTKVPDYAILNEAMEDAKIIFNLYDAKFIHAFVRKGFAQLDAGYESEIQEKIKKLDIIEQFSIVFSMPEWIIKLLLKQYGGEKTEDFLKTMQQPTLLYGRINRLKTDYAQVQQMLGASCVKQGPEPESVLYTCGDMTQTQCYQNGFISQQNISSQKVVQFLNPQSGQRILDMCAAPGGKTAYIAELMGDEGEIIALEIHEHRAKQMVQQFLRLGLKSIIPMHQDAKEYQSEQKFDAILLDAPCSGLGVIGNKPEIRYHLQPTDLDALLLLQRELLQHAWKLLKSDCYIVYSTCTVNKNENEKQIKQFLLQNQDAQLVEEQLLFNQVSEGYHGFYMAKIKKVRK